MNLFLKLADRNGDPFYVRADSIDGVGPGLGLHAGMTALLIHGINIYCAEPVAAVIDAITDSLTGDIIEVEQPRPNEPMNELLHDTLTAWGETISAQIRDCTPEAKLVLAVHDNAPRSSEDGHPYLLPVADVVLLRNLLNAATERGELPE
jgi:hypothetical protein